LGLLIELEPQQSELLKRVCSGPLISAEELKGSDESGPIAKLARTKKVKNSGVATLF